MQLIEKPLLDLSLIEYLELLLFRGLNGVQMKIFDTRSEQYGPVFAQRKQ
jgi:hypothetical protein